MTTLRAGIIGATGYAGAELVRLLAAHPAIAELRVASRTTQGMIANALPAMLQHEHLQLYTPDDANFRTGLDTVFTATPHGVSMDLVADFLQAGVQVVDISADFRLRDADLWVRTYGKPHTCPQYLEQAVYGLPELNATELTGAQLIACPGCYPTSVILALLPVLRAGLAELNSLVADCKSGTSGAGKDAKTHLMLAEAAENFSAYAVEGHRHQPEIEQVLSHICGERTQLVFTPHLVPMVRGMLSTVHFRLSRPSSLESLHQLYAQHYENEPFVHVEPPPQMPQTRWVRGTNLCRIGIAQPVEDRVVVVSAIDNLGKGAAGQAVEAFNIANSLPRTAGLNLQPLTP